MRTADQIEEMNAVKSVTASKKTSKRGQHPNSRKNLLPPYPKGVSGNPGGRQKYDVAAELARAVIEENKEAAYKGLAKALINGNAYVFKELAERGYGKLKETKTIEHVYQEVPDADLATRISDLLADLGLARQVDEAGIAQGVDAGAEAQSVEAEDS